MSCPFCPSVPVGVMETMTMAREIERPAFWYTTDAGPAHPGELAAAEASLGHRLPAAFVALLREQNGGVSRYAGHLAGGRYVSLPPILGVPCAHAHPFGYGTILRANAVREHLGVPDGVVVFATTGRAWMGFDYRAGELEPAVVGQERGDDELRVLARSFADLLRGLVEAFADAAEEHR